MSIKNIFGAAKEELVSVGGLFGTSAKDTAKAFVHIHGSEPLSTMNDIVKAATLDAVAESLEGNIPKEMYKAIAVEGELMADLLSKKPTTAASLSQPHRENPLQLRARGIHFSR